MPLGISQHWEGKSAGIRGNEYVLSLLYPIVIPLSYPIWRILELGSLALAKPEEYQTMSSVYQPTTSVIIPVHNGGTRFRKCLQNLAASNPAPEEIIVVSDGDSDGSWRVAEEFDAQVMRIPTPEGPARA